MEVKFRIMVENFGKVRIKVKYYWLFGTDKNSIARNLLRLRHRHITNYNAETEKKTNGCFLRFWVLFSGFNYKIYKLLQIFSF